MHAGGLIRTHWRVWGHLEHLENLSHIQACMPPHLEKVADLGGFRITSVQGQAHLSCMITTHHPLLLSQCTARWWFKAGIILVLASCLVLNHNMKACLAEIAGSYFRSQSWRQCSETTNHTHCIRSRRSKTSTNSASDDLSESSLGFHQLCRLELTQNSQDWEHHGISCWSHSFGQKLKAPHINMWLKMLSACISLRETYFFLRSEHLCITHYSFENLTFFVGC
jgi:hypothetical protein